MLQKERLDRIEELVNSKKYVTIGELTQALDISKATVRRDLAILGDRKKLIITRGGVMSRAKGTMYELPYFEKQRENIEEKKRIGKMACSFIQEGETIMLDSGTTVYEMTEYMTDFKGICAATCDLMVAIGLTKCMSVDTIMIGGGPVRKGYYNIIGHYPEKIIKQLHFDKAFVSADSIDVVHGGMITNIDEVSLKRTIMESSNEVILLCDHTKFESTAFISVCSIEKISKIITGRELKPDIYQEFIDAGKEIILV